jgi:hypothetical protein
MQKNKYKIPGTSSGWVNEYIKKCTMDENEILLAI